MCDKLPPDYDGIEKEEWLGDEPTPCGGNINRRENLKEHCAYYSA